MRYEAREAELRDQLTRIKSAKKEGKAEGKAEGKVEVAKNLLDMGMEISKVAKVTGLSKEEVKMLLEGRV